MYKEIYILYKDTSRSFFPFLALLGYVSRAHEIEMCQSVCPSQLSLSLMHGFLLNLVVDSAAPYARKLFLIFEKKKTLGGGGFLLIFFVFYLCLTMSPELMKSKFFLRLSSVVHHLSSVHPSVWVAIISEPNAQISFKFWLLLPLGHTLGHFFSFWNFLLLIFYEYFSSSLAWDPMGG